LVQQGERQRLVQGRCRGLPPDRRQSLLIQGKGQCDPIDRRQDPAPNGGGQHTGENGALVEDLKIVGNAIPTEGD
jgi:hypothetical protein